MTAGRKRPTGRAKHTSGEHPTGRDSDSHVVGKGKPPVVRRLEPGEEVPPPRRPRVQRQRGGVPGPTEMRARIAATWEAKRRRDAERAGERNQEEQ